VDGNEHVEHAWRLDRDRELSTRSCA
jgi:hypothetical protein